MVIKMYLYYDKTRTLKTVISHGEPIRQDSDVNIFVCLDRDFFGSDYNIARRSIINATVTYENGKLGANGVISENPDMLLFSKINTSEITYYLKNGELYWTYHLKFDASQISIYPGKVYFNLTVLYDDKEYTFSTADLYVETREGIIENGNIIKKTEYNEILRRLNNVELKVENFGKEIKLQEKTIYPTESKQTITFDEGYIGLSNVIVEAIPKEYIIPTGTLEITENGEYDVATYEKVNVDFPVDDTSVEDSLVTSTVSGEYRNDRIDTVGYYGFSGKKNVTKVTLPNVTSAGSYAFYVCSNLTELDMPKLKTIGASCFYGCTALPKFESDTVESVGDSAFQTTKITSVNIPNAKTIGSSAFRQCSLLTTWKADNVTSIGGSCFRDCPKLVNVTIPKGITSIQGTTFYNCDSLAKIDIPENVKSIIGNAFQQCAALATFIVRKTDGVCTLGAALTGTSIASGTGYIYVPKALLENYKVATNWVNYANQFRAIEDYPEICG